MMHSLLYSPWAKYQTLFLLAALTSLCGCGRVDRNGTNGSPQGDPAANQPPASVDESVVWVERELSHAGATIAIGYRRDDSESGVPQIEPVVSIDRDGQTLANAMVFNQLLAAGDGETDADRAGDPAGDELATVYRQPASAQAAWYAGNTFELPGGAKRCTVRFRVVLPEAEPWTRDTEISLE